MTAARGFLGAGDLYIARQVAGIEGPLVGPFEANKFEIKPNVDLKEQTSKGRTTYGQVTETVALAKPSEFTVELTEVNKDSLAIALLGSTSVIAQASGAVVDEVTIAKLGGYVPLASSQVSSFVLKNSGGTVTYALGTDYELNARLGWYKPLVGGTIVEGASLKASYTKAAVGGTRIAGGTNTSIRARFFLDGVNQADGLPSLVNVWEGVIASSTAFDFLASDFAKITMPGKMKTPVGRSEPFSVDLLSA